jgi:hypothetical protein
MNDVTEQKSTLPDNPDYGVQYLLTEIEYQDAIETKANDRMENMVQYLLTLVVASIGAIPLVAEFQFNWLLFISIACLLVLVVSVSAFYRTCHLRYVITNARVKRNYIRGLLSDLGVQETNRLIKLEGVPTGFSIRVVRSLVLYVVIISIIGGFTGAFMIMNVFQSTGGTTQITTSPSQIFVMMAFFIFTCFTGITLGAVLLNYRQKSDKLIIDSKPDNLSDYDL